MQRRRDVIDDGLAAEVVEENVESLFEPPEVLIEAYVIYACLGLFPKISYI